LCTTDFTEARLPSVCIAVFNSFTVQDRIDRRPRTTGRLTDLRHLGPSTVKINDLLTFIRAHRTDGLARGSDMHVLHRLSKRWHAQERLELWGLACWHSQYYIEPKS
jgi:hypothetical protein